MTKMGSASKSLRVERLESRAMLAASMQVSVSANSLLVIGTTGDDDVTIQRGVDVGTWTVTPGANSQINQLGNGVAQTFTGAPKNVKVFLRTGVDRLVVNGQGAADMSGEFLVRAGDGDKTITLNQLNIAGEAAIRTRAGNDVVTMTNVDVGTDPATSARLVATTLNGADRLTLNGGSEIDGVVILHAGANRYDDVIDVHNASATGDVTLRSTRGNNQFLVDEAVFSNVGNLFGGFEPDTVLVGTRSWGIRGPQVKVYTNQGADQVTMNNSIIDGTLRAFFGDGNDNVKIDGNNVRRSAVMNFEGGDDRLEIGTRTWNQSNGLFLADGGDGMDTIIGDSRQPVREQQTPNWELWDDLADG